MYYPASAQNDEYDELRAGLLAEIQAMVASTRHHTGIERLDPRVAQALVDVPRHEFVPVSLRHQSYENRPLPIGRDQTISQPYIVALMTELAQLDGDDVVLEIGTGSGYQAAVLAELAGHVYTIEIIESLGRNASAVLQRLGYTNVSVRIGDGYQGWPEYAPFDAILVTAAPEQVPEPLLEQLKPGGRIIIPVGPYRRTQSLRVIEKDQAGKFTEHDVLPVSFVPLTRDLN
jgi:protein-L-isoaspartate(D-aspartate) O-methyltransferase